MSPEFKQYVQQVKANAQAVAKALMAKGYKMATGGTENHLVLWDLRPQGLTGSKMEKICDAVSITLNKNAVVGDRSALTPGKSDTYICMYEGFASAFAGQSYAKHPVPLYTYRWCTYWCSCFDQPWIHYD